MCACVVCALPAAAFGGSALGLPGWEGRLGNGSIEDSIISFCLSSLSLLTFWISWKSTFLGSCFESMSFLRPVLLTRRTHLTLVQLSDAAVYPATANETLFHVMAFASLAIL